MLRAIVTDYRVAADLPAANHPFNGNSMAAKDIVKHVFADNRGVRTVLDIGFGVGELARIVKADPTTRHWHVDGIDGFEETCRNAELFNKGWYRNVWHGLAQDIAPGQLAAYDLLCLFDVIEHLDAITAKQLLKTLLEALGPNGRLVLSTPLWFYPQDHNRDGDLEEHLIGVPGRSMLAMQPAMYLISSQFLIGNFVFTKESLRHLDQFQPTTDRSFGLRQGLAHLAELGVQADGVLKVVAPAAPSRTGASAAANKSTPAHMLVNDELLALIPLSSRRIVDVGCMHGALAQAFREKNPQANYLGIDIDPDYVQAASAHCTETLAANIEKLDDAGFARLFPSDCWIFGDCLEHLYDPWRVLQRVRTSIDPDGCALVCLPNAQHWSVQWRLVSGQFRYEDADLMDRTHIRWFTRLTMLEMFQQTGWSVQSGIGRNMETPKQAQALAAVRAFARGMGLNEQQAALDATPLQYVFKLRPA
ncbi:MAG: class I SAM-dependent methyltransferase [Burkholderiaceae bacterium]